MTMKNKAFFCSVVHKFEYQKKFDVNVCKQISSPHHKPASKAQVGTLITKGDVIYMFAISEMSK